MVFGDFEVVFGCDVDVFGCDVDVFGCDVDVLGRDDEVCGAGSVVVGSSGVVCDATVGSGVRVGVRVGAAGAAGAAVVVVWPGWIPDAACFPVSGMTATRMPQTPHRRTTAVPAAARAMTAVRDSPRCGGGCT